MINDLEENRTANGTEAWLRWPLPEFSLLLTPAAVEAHEFEVIARTGAKERISLHKDLIAGSSKVSRWKGNA